MEEGQLYKASHRRHQQLKPNVPQIKDCGKQTGCVDIGVTIESFEIFDQDQEYDGFNVGTSFLHYPQVCGCHLSGHFRFGSGAILYLLFPVSPIGVSVVSLEMFGPKMVG